MADELFRKKSLEKISSPEQLDSYVKVMNIKTWVFCIAIILIIAGFCVWGCVGKLYSYVYGICSVEDISITAYVDSVDYEKVQDGQKCTINGVEFEIETLPQKPIKISEETIEQGYIDQYVVDVAGFQYGQFVYVIHLDNKNIQDGVYYCDIAVETISPFSFLFD